jgi:cell division protein FtsA
VRTLDGRTTKEVAAPQLRDIVVPRVLEIFRMAKTKVIENVPRDLVLGEVVLTGGAAQLPGIEPIAEEVFGLPVRVGAPISPANGLTDTLRLPQYATAIGLVLFGPNGGVEHEERTRRSGSFFTKIRNWVTDLWN